MSAGAMIQFDSTDEAADAYYGDDYDGGGDGGDDDPYDDYDGEWEDPDLIDRLDGGWDLYRQEQAEGDASRYFVIGGPEGGEVLTSGGGTAEINDGDTFDDLPAFKTEEEAREAHQLWLEEHPDYETDGEPESSWTGWETIEEIPPWFIAHREDENSDAEQFTVVGDDRGDNVYLVPGPEITDEPHIYETIEDALAVIEAYFEAVEDGDIDPSEGPTGQPPSMEQLEEDTQPPDDEGLLGSLTENPLLIGGLVVAAIILYYYTQ